MRGLVSLLLALLFAIAPSPARADITAEYYVWGPIGPTMKVQVADNGDARVEMGGHLAAIRRDGVMYLVLQDSRGPFLLPMDEFERIEAQLNRENPPLFPDGDLEGTVIVEAGEETVGGRRGTILVFQTPGEDPSPADMAFVVSRDPDLRPVGEIVARIFGRTMGLNAMPIQDYTTDIFARGTLLRMWTLVRLERTSSEAIPRSAFDLPGPIVSGEEARRRLGPAW